jgi:Tol biopolymer transport system component
VYPDIESDPANIVLWDLKDKKALAKIEEGICFGNYPLWSPDGLRFVVADYLKNSNPVSGEVVEEWASVSREGQVEWLTNFADYFKEVEIEGANWSPDGKRVAFWLRTKPELCQNEVQDLVNLAVLEIQTQIVINYCVWGEPFTAPPPVWSLDGRYIAIRKFDDQGVSQILLVDLEEGWAAPIAGPDVWPVGWLNAP